MAPPSDGLGFPERMANILPSLVLMYVPAVQVTEYEVNKPYQHPVNSKRSQQFSETEVPLDPLITWILSPAPIRAWTSVLLLEPGITISAEQRYYIMKKNIISWRKTLETRSKTLQESGPYQWWWQRAAHKRRPFAGSWPGIPHLNWGRP